MNSLVTLHFSNIQLTRASIRPRPFGRGTEHLSYWVKLASDPNSVKVAKVPIMSKGTEAEKEVCMQDISSQVFCSFETTFDLTFIHSFTLLVLQSCSTKRNCQEWSSTSPYSCFVSTSALPKFVSLYMHILCFS